MGTSDKRDGTLIAGRRLRLGLLRKLSSRPRPYAGRDRDFWTDPYVSSHVLEAHLDPHTDDASRKPRYIAATVDRILEHFGNTDGTTPRMLDLACGPGLYAEQFAARGFDVTAIDFSSVSIDYAKSQATKQGLSIEYREEDLLTADYGGPYDVVTLIYGEFSTFSEKERRTLLHKMKRALGPNGLLVLDVFTERYVRRNRGCDDWYVSERDGFWQASPHLVLQQHFHYENLSASVARYTLVDERGGYRQFNVWWRHFTVSEIRELIESAGFTMEAVYGTLWGDPLEDDGEWIGIYARNRSAE
ncbi:MAG: class I SAM-dependent methyltransferase [Spirochaetota bacterium]